MCTVSWFRNSAGYQLFCNRDELYNRMAGAAPRLQQRHGIRYIAPLDGNYGGSWITVNEYGITLSLLNRYRKSGTFDRGEKPYRSRGLLLLDLADCCCLEEVRNRITRLQLGEYRPFTLAALGCEAPAMLMNWSGCQLHLENDADHVAPLVSSSFDQDGAWTSRKYLFAHLMAERGQIDSEMLQIFHASHLPLRGPYSPCMHRTDASTVSFSRIKVTGEKVEFSYLPGAPCQQAGACDGSVQANAFLTVSLPAPSKLEMKT